MSENPYRLPASSVPAPPAPAPDTTYMPSAAPTPLNLTNATRGEQLRAALENNASVNPDLIDKTKTMWRSRIASVIGFAAFVSFFVLIGSWHSLFLFSVFFVSIICGAVAMAWASLATTKQKNRDVNFVVALLVLTAGIIGFPLGLIVFVVTSLA